MLVYATYTAHLFDLQNIKWFSVGVYVYFNIFLLKNDGLYTHFTFFLTENLQIAHFFAIFAIKSL